MSEAAAVQNSNLVACKSCSKEVAKSAKKCPHCGQKLKMGLFPKMIIGFVGLIILAAVFSPSSEDKIAALQQASVANISPSGELQAAFSLMSDYTDIQRENLTKDLTGKTVVWELPVYEVDKRREGVYRIQTASSGVVGTFTTVYAQSEEQARYIESLKTDDLIKFKGTIQGTMLRNIDIDPAIIVQ